MSLCLSEGGGRPGPVLPTTISRAAPLWLSQWQGWTVDVAAKKLCLCLRATLQMGAAIKEEEKKRPKYPESWVYNWLGLSAFLCVWSTAAKHSEPPRSPSETLHFPFLFLPLRPPIQKVVA